MKIQIKQVEIVAALSQYLTSKGIDLVGKDVSIAFTAGRKASGLSADISIEDSDGADVTAKVIAKAASLAVVPKAVIDAKPDNEDEPADAEVEVAEEPKKAAAAKTSSLFG